jgi:hypothetical protein
LTTTTLQPTTIGKYLVSPLTRRLDDGRYQSSVSIRSGQGRAMHDRVLRFTQPFMTPLDALRYAAAQGREWVSDTLSR